MEYSSLYLLPCVLFFLSSFQIISPSSDNSCLHDQSSALLQFKQSFSIHKFASQYPTNYPKTESWKPDTDCCHWDGVTCDKANGHVIGLDLSNSWLYGPFHSNTTLFHLRHLQTLSLAYNDFYPSPIPYGFHLLTNLTHLNFSSSGFSGQIPLDISGLTKLVSLDLSRNDISLKPEKHSLGTLVQRLTNLRELDLNGVNISSVVPDLLADLSSLTYLHLGSCQLYGTFPKSIFLLPNLQSLRVSDNPNLTLVLPEFHSGNSLRFLDLSSTNFSGELPASIGKLKLLNSLYLLSCQLYGTFPVSIFLLPNLQSLDVSDNPNLTVYLPKFHSGSSLRYLDLSSTNFSGELPDLISKLKLLNSLSFSSYQLYGTFPKSIFLLPNLQSLSVSYKSNLTVYLLRFHPGSFLRDLELVGMRISREYVDSISKLKHLNGLSLRNCNFSGSIPSSLGNLTQLTKLDFSYNNFSHQIPPLLRNLTHLVYLDLSNNQFSGRIPSILANLTHLEYLSLWNNQLTGPIPSYVSGLPNLSILFLDGNSLSGTVELNMFLTLKNLTSLYLSDNTLSLITTVHINSTFPKFQGLGLSSCNISEFPDFLKNQNELEWLDLSNNKIHGQIPKWMWNIGKETLNGMNLSYNFLQGLDEPPAILPWGGLQYLDLQSNQLQGPLPIPPISTSFFSISNNKLTGEIPSLICKSSSLEILDLSNNSLSGLIPQCLGNFSNSISVLKLRRNRFHGTIPQKFSTGSNLRTLDFNGNLLKGRVPRSLVNCKRLEVLDLGNNQLNDTFPFWLESLPELQVLDLRFNKLHGPIGCPQTNCAFSTLRIIDLSYNEFTGHLPSTYFLHWSAMMMSDENKSEFKYMGRTYYHDSVTITIKGLEMVYEKILTSFTAIDFSNNKFQGEIPESIGNLRSLHALNFSGNSLTGSIPSSLGNLTELESLDLSQNTLSGEIPQQLATLTFLEVLKLSRNHLKGPIPRGPQFDTFSNTSYEGNSGLCGVPLVKKCVYTDVVQPPKSLFHQDQDSEATSEEFDWQIVSSGYGCGVIIGVVIGYTIFWRQNGWLRRRMSSKLSKWEGKMSKKKGDNHKRR
ncbi:hypothetical protein HHK36_023407 [Tetracentron sinense]|uniref:Leucine-rich repeat-containing N-terminal plant-type domain-containing protein n=1 Tax=Tetracentron sinense TaxID=13715 RepID=A0A834YQ99_TETSI|nr:hypothetical protein HHK36_023407 [Tetracentron sinense]